MTLRATIHAPSRAIAIQYKNSITHYQLTFIQIISHILTFSTMSQETIHPAFSDKCIPLVSYGIPFTESCTKHVREDFKASRVYLIAGKSLTQNTSFTSDLQKALGSNLATTRIGMAPHTLMSEVLEMVEDCRAVNADCIVTLGGGTLSDAAKVITFVCLSILPDVSKSDMNIRH